MNNTQNVTYGTVSEGAWTSYTPTNFITPAWYTAINISGGNRANSTLGSGTVDSYFLWNISLPDYDNVTRILLNSTFAQAANNGTDTMVLGVFNFTGNTWFTATTVNNPGKFKYVSLLYNITPGLSTNLVHDNMVFFMVRTYGTTSTQTSVSVDYMNASFIYTDPVYPSFTNSVESPANSTKYVSGAVYNFNSTVSNINDTVGIQFNGANYTADNSTLTVYNDTISNLAAGTYMFYWWGWSNGNTRRYNNSDIDYYTILNATGNVTVYINNSQSNITITAGDSILLNATLIAGVGDIDLYNDGIIINHGTSPISNTTTFATPGSYNITAYYTGNQNYTDSWSITRWVDVQAAPSTCTYSGTGNWALNCADNCVFTGISTITGGNNVTITGTGVTNFTGGNWSFTGTSQYVTIGSGCTLNLDHGGWNQ